MNKINTYVLQDNGGRRLGIDRRCFSYSNHIPERRQGVDRRNKIDRRSGKDQRDDCNFTCGNMYMRIAAMDRRIAWRVAGDVN